MDVPVDDVTFTKATLLNPTDLAGGPVDVKLESGVSGIAITIPQAWDPILTVIRLERERKDAAQ